MSADCVDTLLVAAYEAAFTFPLKALPDIWGQSTVENIWLLS
jgi:hypothetical protein